MLTLNLHTIFKVKGIDNPAYFLMQKGFTRHSANLLVDNSKNSIRFDHIEQLCTILNCELADLFQWVPDNDTTNIPAHPLHKLSRQAEPLNVKDTLMAMPYTQLKEIVKNMQFKEL